MTTAELKAQFQSGEITQDFFDAICARNWLYGETNTQAHARARRMNPEHRAQIVALYRDHMRDFDRRLESMFAGLRNHPQTAQEA